MRTCLLLLLASGTASAGVDVLLTGSAAVDYRYVTGTPAAFNPSPLGINGLTIEVAQKMVAEVGHGVGFTVKACLGCHGVEVDQASAEWRIKHFFNARVGRLNVPIGEFVVRHDPTNFVTPSKPLPYAMGDMLEYTTSGFNLGIVPAPYVDNGAELFGSVPLSKSVQLDYSVYVVKGLAGTNDIDFVQSRAYVDNNKLPSVGARLVLTANRFSLGASGMYGTYDAKDQLTYAIAGVDVYGAIGPVKVRAEAIARRTDLDPKDAYKYQLRDAWFLKAGWVVEADIALHKIVTVALRSDGLVRLGMPLPESELSPQAFVFRQTAAVLVQAQEHFAIKADYELWNFVGAPFPMRHMVRLGVVAGY